MNEQTFSLGEIAPILARSNPESDVSRIQRQVRHWTIHNLLQPAKKHTGRGRDRRYTAHQIRKAAVYMELARFGMTVGLLEGVSEWLDMLEEENSALWNAAKERALRVFMRSTWTAEESYQGGLLVHDDDFEEAKKWGKRYRNTIFPVASSFTDRMQKALEGSYSHVYVNLTALFKSIDV